jgi:hypothetical protein
MSVVDRIRWASEIRLLSAVSSWRVDAMS